MQPAARKKCQEQNEMNKKFTFKMKSGATKRKIERNFIYFTPSNLCVY